jgi:lysozyme family protein
MSEQNVWTIDFLREEALARAAPYAPGTEPFSALKRAAEALQDAAAAVRRHEARAAMGASVLGVVDQTGPMRFYGRRAEV